jgi:hypothetical protein
MPPQQIFNDGEEVVFTSPIIAARFGPANNSTLSNTSSSQLVNVTKHIRALISCGRTRFVGGIHTALDIDPAPGMPKVLYTWLADKPHQSFGQEDTIQFKGTNIIAAIVVTQKSIDEKNYLHDAHHKDITEQVRKLVASGRSVIESGWITGALNLGDPFPNFVKLFQIWYY